MKDKVVEILKNYIPEAYIKDCPERIANLYSAGEEVSDEKINDKANELYLYAFDGDVFDGTEIKIQGAWVKGAKWMRSKLTRPTVSEEEIYNKVNGLIWLGDGGKIMGVPDVVEAIKELLNR